MNPKRKRRLAHFAHVLAAIGIEDANESLTFSKELEAFVGNVYEMQFPDLSADKLFPADPAVHVADTSYTTRKMQQAARAVIDGGMATEIPMASYDAKGEDNFPIRSLVDGYRLTIQDLRAAQKLNRPLEMKLAESCKRAHLELQEQISFFGDTSHGLKGLFSDAGVLANSTAKVGVAWDDPAITLAIVLADIERMWKKIEVDTNRLFVPDTLALSGEAFSVFHAPIALGTVGFTTVAKIVMEMYGPRGLKEILPSSKLDIGTTGAVGGAPRQVLYKKDPLVLASQTPILFEQLPPQAKGLALETICHSRHGGVHVEQHKAITFMDGCVT